MATNLNYDEAERRNLMPNPKGHRPIGDYIQAFKKAKEIFPGEVATQLIAGIQNEAKYLEGFELFAGVGVPTLLTPFLVGGLGKKLKRETGADVPSADKMKSIYERGAAILVKHNCPPAQFRGGVCRLAEFMGKRWKWADVVTHDFDKAKRTKTPAPDHSKVRRTEESPSFGAGTAPAFA